MSIPFDVQEFYQNMLARKRAEIPYFERRILLLEGVIKLEEMEIADLGLQIAGAKALIEKLEVLIRKGEE